MLCLQTVETCGMLQQSNGPRRIARETRAVCMDIKTEQRGVTLDDGMLSRNGQLRVNHWKVEYLMWKQTRKLRSRHFIAVSKTNYCRW